MGDISREKPWFVPRKWNVSQYNYRPEVRAGWALPSRVKVHDVTLRDGEQAPGVVFRKDEKVRIAHALADLGVHRIEGGLASVSEEDAEAIATMAREIDTAEICNFTRTRQDDLELAIKCGVDRAIMEIPAMRSQVDRIWGGTEKAVEAFVKLSELADQNGVKTTLFLMDATRADLQFLQDLIFPCVKYGKIDSVGLVDTRGSCLPQAMAWLISSFKNAVDVAIEVHAHNQWGLATATTLAAVTAGAEVIHTSVNGLNGNAALEECVMGVHAVLGIETGIKTEGFTALSKMVIEAARQTWYKPFVGPMVAGSETGIASRRMWDQRHEFGYGRAEALNYEVVGGKPVELVLGKKSGTYSIMLKSWELGLPVPERDMAQQMQARVKALAEQKKSAVTEEEFRVIYQEVNPEGIGQVGL